MDNSKAYAQATAAAIGVDDKTIYDITEKLDGVQKTMINLADETVLKAKIFKWKKLTATKSILDQTIRKADLFAIYKQLFQPNAVVAQAVATVENMKTGLAILSGKVVAKCPQIAETVIGVVGEGLHAVGAVGAVGEGFGDIESTKRNPRFFNRKTPTEFKTFIKEKGIELTPDQNLQLNIHLDINIPKTDNFIKPQDYQMIKAIMLYTHKGPNQDIGGILGKFGDFFHTRTPPPPPPPPPRPRNGGKTNKNKNKNKNNRKTLRRKHIKTTRRHRKRKHCKKTRCNK